MKNIQMIPIKRLKHHPENPRKDLGDLTELAESIKKNGIMQNLTVVYEGDEERHEMSTGRLLVVIGNRRMEAAKMAGLEEVPCVISYMDRREQIATMLEENMQRADLSLYEQAQGFQMMMDLGFTQKEISEKTGFSETTVNRRLKMAELDGKTLKKAMGMQITMDDLDRLGQIEDIKKRNELLEQYGENNFYWMVNAAIKRQKADRVRPKAMVMIAEAKVKPIPEKDKYSLYGKYESKSGWLIELDKWDGKSNIIPKTDGELYYRENGTDIEIYQKVKKQRAEAVSKSAEEQEEDRKRDLAWKTVDRIAENSAELRERFAEGMNVSPKNAMRTLQWAMIAMFGAALSYETPTQALKKKLGIEGHTITDNVAEMGKKMMEVPQSKWPGLILLLFEGDWQEYRKKPPTFADGSRNYQFPTYSKNVRMELCYNWLTENGYQMSTEEIEMMAGTHPVFQTEVEA